MKRLFKKPIIFVLVIVFFGVGLFSSRSLGPIGMVSVAEATHSQNTKGQGHGGGGGPPPTVSELPIQYMVAGGIAFILLSGGIVYLTRNRSKKQSSEV